MTKYLVLYLSDSTAQEQMAQGTSEERKAGMDAWMAWAGLAGEMIVDLGSPLQAIEPAGGKQISGLSIMEAESTDALKKVLDAHPHLHMPGGVINAYEFLAMPGM